MNEFTEEQEQAIQNRIVQAQDDIRKQQQWIIAGDQFYRDSLITIHSKVQQGLYDNYILEVGKALYNAFRTANLPQVKQQSEPKQQPVASDFDEV